jgi:hypothetical protein
MRLTRHVASLAEIRCVYTIFVGIFYENIRTERTRSRWTDNIIIDLREIVRGRGLNPSDSE